MVSLQSDIVGRVKRLGLKPTEKTALLPLQEALSNALHAIDDKYQQEAASLGKIEVEVLYKEGPGYRSIDGFSITDNGVGLGSTQFDAFCKPDTIYKIARGGKGVGRLVWLKTFSIVSINSKYSDGKSVSGRNFDFVLAEQDQIRNMTFDKYDGRASTGTIVKLKGFDPSYSGRCPNTADGISKHVVSHFMPILAAGTAPEVTLIVDGIKQDLVQFFKANVLDQRETKFEIEYEGENTEITVATYQVQ